MVKALFCSCAVLLLCILCAQHRANAFYTSSKTENKLTYPWSQRKSVQRVSSYASTTFTTRNCLVYKLQHIPDVHRWQTFLVANELAESSKKPLSIIIAGAPASGKGTQCEIIKEKYGVVHLSTGDMLRAAVAAQSPVGLAAKEFMDSGKLVPDDVIIGVVQDRLNEHDCQTKGWLLDGFPRTRAQADALNESGIAADCFIFLNVSDEILVERVVGRRTDPVTGKIYHMKFSPPDDEEVWKRLVQRSDDTEEKVKIRLEQFHKNVASVQGCYEDIMIEVNGNAKPEDVAGSIQNALAARLSG